MSLLTQSTVKAYDNYSGKLTDRSSISVRFVEKFRPVGTKGFVSFFEFVQKLTGESIPEPTHILNCPLAPRPTQDIRMVFASAGNVVQAIRVFRKLDFSMAKIVNVCYVDIEASSRRLDNSSIRVLMEQFGDSKAEKIITKGDEGGVLFEANDPFRQLLVMPEDRNKTPPRAERSVTPLVSPTKENRTEKRIHTSTASLLLTSDQGGPAVKKNSPRGTKSVEDADIKSTEDSAAFAKPATREEARTRLSSLQKREEILSSSSADRAKAEISKMKEEKAYLQLLMDQDKICTESDGQEWDWDDILEYWG